MNNNKITFIFFLLSLIPEMMLGQLPLEGTYYYKAGGLQLVFHPQSQDNATNYSWYEAKYDNGMIGSSTYTLSADQLILHQFNYGRNQTFRIVILNTHELILETVGLVPPQKFHLEKYSPVLAIDQNSGLVLTQREVDGYFGLITFYANLCGQSLAMDEPTGTQYTSQLIYQFNNSDLQTKRYLCSLGLLNEYIQKGYGQLSDQQRLAFQNEVNTRYQPYTANYDNSLPDYTDPANLWPTGVDTPEEKRAYLEKKKSDYQMNQFTFNTMQNMMMQQQSTSLNIIENMGNSGDYWEIKYNDY